MEYHVSKLTGNEYHFVITRLKLPIAPYPRQDIYKIWTVSVQGQIYKGEATGGSPTINGHLLVSVSPIDSGVRRAKFCAEGAVLENYTDVLEKLFLKNAIKRKKLYYIGFRKIFVIFSKNCLLKLQ